MSDFGNSLSQGWRQRLAALEVGLKARPEDVFAWHARVEAKVLRFLLARYPDGRGTSNLGPSRVFVSPLAFIASPKVRPVKRERMKLLRHIARENALVRAMSLSPWERFCDDFDRRIEVGIHQNRLQRRREARMKERQKQFQQRRRNQKW